MATTANVVKLKRSAVAGRVPATGDLALGELALNTYDGRIYLKKSVASVESIVTLQSFPTGGTNGQDGNYSVTIADETHTMSQGPSGYIGLLIAGDPFHLQSQFLLGNVAVEIRLA